MLYQKYRDKIAKESKLYSSCPLFNPGPKPPLFQGTLKK